MSQPLIQPNQIDGLPFFDAAKKAQYKTGLTKLWQQRQASAEGSPERLAADNNIRAASARIMSELAASKNVRPGTSGGGQPRPPTQGGMNTPQQQAGMAQQAGMPQGSLPQPGGGGNGQGQQQQQSGQPQLSQYVQQQISGINVNVPQNVTPQQAPAYKSKWFQQAITWNKQREHYIGQASKMQQAMRQMQAAGQEVPQNLRANYEQVKQNMQEADRKWTSMKADNENKGRLNQQAQAQAQQMGQQAPQQVVNGGQDMSRSNTFQGESSGIKQETRMSQSPPQPQNQFTQQAQPQVNQNAPSQNPQGMGQQAPPQQPQQTPQTATQTQPPQNYPQQQQYQQAQQRPQMNTQLSQAQIQQQTPTSAMPNSATQQNQQQRPQPLTQAAAMAQAAEQYRGQQQQLPNQQQQQPSQPQIPHGLPFNQPGSATQPTPTSGFPSQPSSLQATQTPTNKFPINKTIHMSQATQQPQPGPPSRPTLGSQGMFQQPGVARPPPYTLEGEGDRVLSKRKLDELVRQVTGTSTISPVTSPSSAEGVLAPEVEESVLSLADDFVDSIIDSACKLAKLRPNAVLEIRDVQMVLERNYGIRIPGFTLDEVRTVRKFVPSAGWQSKMQAVQTSKTLGGVGSKADA